MAASPDASAQATKALKEEFKEIERMAGDFKLIKPPSGVNVDPANIRFGVGRQVIPKLTPQFERMTEFAGKSPAAEVMARIELLDLTSRLAYWGQPEAIASIRQMADSDIRATAVRGRIAQQFLALRLAEDDAAAQDSALGGMQSLAEEIPLNNDIAQAILYLVDRRQMSVKQGHRLNIVVDKMKAPDAVAYSKLPTRIYEPLSLKGISLDGAEISSDKWKGKVVMVDFWATWCPPCRAALPAVISTYKKYHDQGFEILGVSNDMVKRDLTTFLDQNPDMVWPQLFTANSNGSWHPLAKKLQISGVPTVYLIDRDGILREQETGLPLRDEMIAKVLAETDDAVATPAAAPAMKSPPVAKHLDSGGL